jgi:hypothetical protein
MEGEALSVLLFLEELDITLHKGYATANLLNTHYYHFPHVTHIVVFIISWSQTSYQIAIHILHNPCSQATAVQTAVASQIAIVLLLEPNHRHVTSHCHQPNTL